MAEELTRGLLDVVREKWQHRLGLGDWRVRVAWEPSDGRTADSQLWFEKKAAIIRVRRDLPEWEVERAICHEMLHVLFIGWEAPLLKLAGIEPDTGKAKLSLALEEQVVEKLVVALTGQEMHCFLEAGDEGPWLEAFGYPQPEDGGGLECEGETVPSPGLHFPEDIPATEGDKVFVPHFGRIEDTSTVQSPNPFAQNRELERRIDEMLAEPRWTPIERQPLNALKARLKAERDEQWLSTLAAVGRAYQHREDEPPGFQKRHVGLES